MPLTYNEDRLEARPAVTTTGVDVHPDLVWRFDQIVLLHACGPGSEVVTVQSCHIVVVVHHRSL
jgi:hypothetical protein